MGKIKIFLSKYEPYLSPVTLLGGFIFDNFTLRRVDLWAENLFIMIYLGIATTAVIILNLHDTGWFKFFIFRRTPVILPYVLQFVFGGLFSAFFIFYSRSASFAGSWPFLIFFVFLMVGNELFRGKYTKTVFQASVLYIAYFSYLVFAMPVFLRQMNYAVFIASGLASLVMISFLGLFFYLVMPKIFNRNIVPAGISIAVIYVAFNLFYYFNLIPPIPLALKDSGIYHHVARAGNDYRVVYEPSAWYDVFKDYDSEFNWRQGEPVYCFTSVFAPTEISAKIYHRWFLYDSRTSDWVEKDRLGFLISGGRDGGYRGFSFKHAVEPGRWRIDIENERGQKLGRVKFDIIEAQGQYETETKTIQ